MWKRKIFLPYSEFLAELRLPTVGTPSLESMSILQQFFIANSLSNYNGLALTLDVQTERLTQKKGVDVGFEGLIYTQGVLKTRPGHWHDLFHALVWLRFPKTKAILNKLQYMAQKGRFERGEAQRTPLENALTLFDEGGIVAIKDKGVTSEFIIFGHALLEHVVLQSDATTRKNSPYVSGTTIAIEEENVSNFQMIDKKLAQYFAENFSHLTPKQFYSTPLYSLTEDFGELKQYF